MDRVIHDKEVSSTSYGPTALTSSAVLIATLERETDQATFYRLQHKIEWAIGAVSDVIIEVYAYDSGSIIEDYDPCFAFRFEAGEDLQYFTRIVGGPYDQFRVYAKLSTSDDNGDTDLTLVEMPIQTRLVDA